MRGSDERTETMTPLFPPIIDPDYPEEATLEEQFEIFHDANPHVYRAILALCRKATIRGLAKWSIRGIFEILRWESGLETAGNAWKLNNNFAALYARMVMRHHWEYRKFFEIRKMREAPNVRGLAHVEKEGR